MLVDQALIPVQSLMFLAYALCSEGAVSSVYKYVWVGI